MNRYLERIELLRREMKKEGIDCYIVVTDDFHASEYVGDFFKEREFLTGFTGTNGTLVVTRDFAGLWTDGRYFIQAEEELKGSSVTLMKDGEEGVPEIAEFVARDITSRDIESKNVESRDIESRDIESKNVESRDVESRDIESKNIEPRDIESKDIESKNIESKDMAACNRSVYKIGYDGRTINYEYGRTLRKDIDSHLHLQLKNGETDRENARIENARIEKASIEKARIEKARKEKNACIEKTTSIEKNALIEKTGWKVEFSIDKDLTDRIWIDRPKMSSNPVWKLDEKYAGVSSEEKINNLREKAFGDGVDGVLVTALDEIAWLYNLRGSDIDYTPVFMAYSIITKDEAIIYTDCFGRADAKDEQGNKNYISDEEAKMRRDGVGAKEEAGAGQIPGWIKVKPYYEIYKDVTEFDGAIYMDQDTVNEALTFCARHPVFGESLIALDKAVKNGTEIENEKLAHIKDGVALTKTIYWLRKLSESGGVYSETELSVEKHLTDLRKEQEGFIDLSFASIVATGEHGAIVHYEPTEDSNRNIEEGFLLIDTGAHYLEGSTDVTRTVSIGAVSDEMKEHYTRVLKGHIDVAIAEFEKAKTGPYLDEIARKPLQEISLDFKHGTGHGVGYILNVHEGPNSIRKKRTDGKPDPTFLPGMITSNEPGLYLEGKYGIRIENLILSKQFELKKENTNKSIYDTTESNSKESDAKELKTENFDSKVLNTDDMLEFENLTLVPYDKASIKLEMLNENEKKYLSDYAIKVYKELSPYLSQEERVWLKEEMNYYL